MKKASRCCDGRVDTVGVKLAEGKGPGQKHRDAKTAVCGRGVFERIGRPVEKAKAGGLTVDS